MKQRQDNRTTDWNELERILTDMKDDGKLNWFHFADTPGTSLFVNVPADAPTWAVTELIGWVTQWDYVCTFGSGGGSLKFTRGADL